DHAPAEAELPRPDVGDARRAPRVVAALLRPTGGIPSDRAAEERSDVAPTVPDDGARGGEADADVELPQRPPHARRDAELEPGDDAARPDDARQLRERRGGVFDVAQEVGEGERVERRVLERERLGGSLDELDAPVRAPPGLREHPAALIHTDDAAAVPRNERSRDEPGAGRDVEDTALGTRVDARDEEAPPARVLPERQDGGAPLVRGAERGEQRLGIHRRESKLGAWSSTGSPGRPAPTAR